MRNIKLARIHKMKEEKKKQDLEEGDTVTYEVEYDDRKGKYSASS